MAGYPRTLVDAIRYFANPDVALDFVAKLRWPNGPVCPRCEAVDVSFLSTRRLWKCKACKKQFSVKVGTIFEDSPLGLDKWLPAVWMVANCKNGISSYEMARALGVSQKSAWFMDHRIRLAMQQGSFQKLTGQVEVDELIPPWQPPETADAITGVEAFERFQNLTQQLLQTPKREAIGG